MGKLADLVVLDGDPLTEPALFDQPDRVLLVVKGGKVVKNLRAGDPGRALGTGCHSR